MDHGLSLKTSPLLASRISLAVKIQNECYSRQVDLGRAILPNFLPHVIESRSLHRTLTKRQRMGSRFWLSELF